MNTYEEEYAALQKEFIGYIAKMRADIQSYISKNKNVSPFFVTKQNEKIERLKRLKLQYDGLFQQILNVIDNSYETGRKYGIEQRNKEIEKEIMPFSKYSIPRHEREFHRNQYNDYIRYDKWADFH